MRRRLIVIAVAAVVVAACGAVYASWPHAATTRANHRNVGPGETLVLRGGVTVSVPDHGWSADYMRERSGTADSTDYGVRLADALALSATSEPAGGLRSGTVVQVMTFSDPTGWDTETAAWGAEPPPVAYRSADGTVQVRWRVGQPNRVLVVASPPAQEVTGVYVISPGFKPKNAKHLSRMLHQLWETFAIRGIDLPAV